MREMEKRFEVVNEMRQHIALSPMVLVEKQRRDYEPGCVGAAGYGIIQAFLRAGGETCGVKERKWLKRRKN